MTHFLIKNSHSVIYEFQKGLRKRLYEKIQNVKYKFSRQLNDIKINAFYNDIS